MIPIVQSLLGSRITRLRALVVLPTRDLALQVKASFDALSQSLKIGVCCGLKSFEVEKNSLIDEDGNSKVFPILLLF